MASKLRIETEEAEFEASKVEVDNSEMLESYDTKEVEFPSTGLVGYYNLEGFSPGVLAVAVCRQC